MVGKAGGEFVRIVGLADEVISVDRIKLLRGGKIKAISEILNIVKDVRRRKFDFVIDLHSLYETNLLGFVSGAEKRLFANRENRSLDFLSNFRPPPPREDKKKHLTDFYLDVLKPLGVEGAGSALTFSPKLEDIEGIEDLFQSMSIADKTLIGINLGAGHPSRCWDIGKFAEIASELSKGSDQVLIFFGPEEQAMWKEVKAKFPSEAIILDKLKLPRLAAAFARLKVLIGNDTGPVHLAAVVGTPIVLILDNRSPTVYLPLAERIRIVNSETIDKIPVRDVLRAARGFLSETPESPPV